MLAISSKVEIRPLDGDEKLQEGVAKLRTLVYYGYPAAHDLVWHSAIWRWLADHPLADKMQRWIMVDGDEVVGHLAATPQYYRIDGERVVAHTPADYQVLPGYGFQALLLMRKFFRFYQNCVACDLSPTAAKIEESMGAAVVGKLQYTSKLLDASMLPKLQAPMPAGIPRLLSAGLQRIPRLLSGGLQMLDKAYSNGFADDLRVEVIEEFDASFDELFEAVAAGVPCIPEKDTAFLRWRYGPASPQSPVSVLGVREGRTLLGYAVLRVHSEDKKGSLYTAGYLLDLATRPGRHDVARALLRQAADQFKREGAYIVRYQFLESPTSARSSDLLRSGFFRHNSDETCHVLLVRFADQDLHKAALDPTNWSYTTGDGEASFWVR
jgi:hypothetical protein